jgi:LPPG:FO 2-phospho-L-lactate transferase
MSDQSVRTCVRGPDGWLGFQEYFVREKTQVEVVEVDYAGARSALPAPGVVEAIASAHAVIVCPSNPVTSIGPILAVPGIARALEATDAVVIAVSPIVGGQAVSGPAGRLMAARGLEVSAPGVASAYAPWLDVLLVDNRDAALTPRIEAAGIRTVVTETVMHGREGEIALARRALEALA